MARNSIFIMRGMEPELMFISPAVRVDEYYGGINAHTMSIAAYNFIGKLTIQASIKATPTENDWFGVKIGDAVGINYPRNSIFYTPETSTATYNFTGRFIWMRAEIDRTDLLPPMATPADIARLGIIDRILVNLG